MTPRIEGIVLAGGQSSRFGSDKCLFHLDGVPLVNRAVVILESIGLDVTILTAASSVQIMSRFAKSIADEAELRGPVQPLWQAARKVSSTHFAVLPCDTPFVAPESISELVRTATDGDFDACIARDSSGRVHPLIGCFSKGIDVVAEQLLSQGSPSVHDLIDELNRVHFLDIPDSEVVNINTMEEAAAASKNSARLL